MKNTNYTQPWDLLADDDFFAWYYHTEDKKVEAWNDWIRKDLFNQHLAEEAVYLLVRSNIEEDDITDAQIKELTKSFINTIVAKKKQVNFAR